MKVQVRPTYLRRSFASLRMTDGIGAGRDHNANLRCLLPNLMGWKDGRALLIHAAGQKPAVYGEDFAGHEAGRV
jgi:hypothetical protein